MVLTDCEYVVNVNRLLLEFACFQYEDAIDWKWKIKKFGNDPVISKLLWLFVYALNSFDHTDGAINYITEQQAMDMFAKINAIQV